MIGMLACLSAAAVFAQPTLSDPQLADLRAGFALPGGIDVAVVVTTQTSVDGAVLLKSVYRVDQSTVSLEAFAPTGSDASQLHAVDLKGAAVGTGSGLVSSEALRDNLKTHLAGDNIDVSHLFGGAVGSIITNTANNRTIDSDTAVNLTLSHVTTANLGSAGLRVDALALDATRALVAR